MRQLEEILVEINPDIITNPDENLIEAGFITSLDIISIISEFEMELHVEIQPEDIIAENFVSYKEIKKLFCKYIKGDHQ